MSLIKKFIKKNVNDVLKEGEVYTISKDDLCTARYSVFKSEIELNQMQLKVNSMRDKVSNGQTIRDFDLVCLFSDLQLVEARMKDICSLLPNPHAEGPREV